MRSCSALYIDAGYLLASAATRVCGTSLRASVQVDHEQLLEGLIEQVERDSGLPLMRANWYDSGNSSGGQPDAHQVHLGMMPRVKLRLGRRSYSGEQKGVDLRLGLDLVTQARNRAIDIAYLLSGDDDLTEAVEEAQDHGVQVVVFAVPTAQDTAHAVARHLQMEADGLVLIDGGIIDRTVTRLPRTAEAQLRAEGAAAAAMRAISAANGSTDDPANGVLNGSAGGPANGAVNGRSEGPGGSASRDTERAQGGQPCGGTDVTPAEGDTAAPAALDDGTGPASGAHPTPAVLSRLRSGAAKPAAQPGQTAQRPVPRPQDEGAQLVYSTTASHNEIVVTDNYSNRVSDEPEGRFPLVDADPESIDAVCRSVLHVWLESATEAERHTLDANRPAIPSEVDRALLRDLSMRINVYEIAEQDRHALRAHFWTVADQRFGEADNT